MLSTALRTSETSLTIAELVEDFLSYCTDIECLSHWTITTRATHLHQFRDYCIAKKLTDVSFLTLPFVDEYFVIYTKKRSKNTANTGRRILKVFLSWIRDYKELEIRFDPHRIKLVKTLDATPRYIERSVIENAIRSATERQDKIMIALSFEAGLRISELVNVRVGDLFDGKVHVTGKGSIERNNPISDSLFHAIRLFVKERNNNDFIFHNDDSRSDGSMKIKTARLRMQACFEKIGVTMYPHQLRHSIAIELLNNGCDVVTIQRILGHSDLKTTQKYLRISDSFMKEQHNKYLGRSVI